MSYIRVIRGNDSWPMCRPARQLKLKVHKATMLMPQFHNREFRFITAGLSL